MSGLVLTILRFSFKFFRLDIIYFIEKQVLHFRKSISHSSDIVSCQFHMLFDAPKTLCFSSVIKPSVFLMQLLLYLNQL